MEPRVHFYLDRALSDTSLKALPREQRIDALAARRQIWVFLTFLKNDRIKVYTGERVPQAVWDFTKERVNANKFREGAHDFNEWLSGIETKIINEIRARYRFQRSEQPSRENIQALIKSIINESHEVQAGSVKSSTVLELISAYLDKNKKDWTEGFIEITSATVEHLKAFETWRKKSMSITDDFSLVWSQFKDYLVEKKFNNSTANKYLKLFRRLLKRLSDDGFIKLDVEDLKSFKELDSFRIALTEKEIETIAKTIFPEAHLTKARDLMIIQLFTGQRVGDLPQVLEQIKAGGDIHITQGKTNTRLTIPKYPLLDKHLKAIAKQHPEGLETFSEQKYNQYIKDCCKRAGIDRAHTYEELKGDKKEKVTKHRYDLISSHTCRRTFATLADKRGISHKSIMAITGHTSHKVFLEYIRVDDESINQEFNTKMI